MPKILIVEDNEEGSQSLSRWLQGKGFEVVMARDGQEGVAVAQSEKPDLVLMDMNMPVLDGWEATQQIKAFPETKDLPVIALSALGLAQDRDRALKAGCVDFFSKPVDFPELLAHVEEHLKGRAKISSNTCLLEDACLETGNEVR
jgi:two-component system, cell cycle response regulator DivK